MQSKRWKLGVSIGSALLALMVSWALAQTPIREITQLAGEVYRFRNNNHYSIFAVTPAGIIATDPINAEAAQWLKAELQRRFGQPVKYVVYSHDHADHIAGGEIFADTAVVVAHENAKSAILAVLQYAREGKSVEEMKTLIKLPKYEKWAGYQQMFPLNIEGMYRHVQLHRRPNP
jgi:glyoxylase-like metal-dependent hydrolase (beta-lactamase superfamily II)